MYKTLALAIVLALGTVSTAYAAKASKEESIGVGSGAAVGAAAGGPVGFIIGAAIGAKIGDTMHRKRETIESLNASLDDSRGDVAGLEQELRTVHADLDRLKAELGRIRDVDRPQLAALMEAGIAMDLLFRTDEYALADATGDRLAGLAKRVAKLPDIRVRLDGYADERGAADYNLELSQKRVEFVRDRLVAAGIDRSRIRIAAHGESATEDDSVDNYAFERRVTLKLFIGDAQPFASNPAGAP